jgi:mono/diheme cytochrome c family protein
MKPVLLLVTGGLIVLALGALALWRGESVLDRADAENLDQIGRGRVVYAEHCASCHGDNLQGQPDWRIRKADGKLPAPEGYESDMPAFAETLSDEEIWAVLSFIKSTWSEQSRAYQERIDQAYKRQAGEQ